MLVLPEAVNWAIIAGVVIGGLSLVWSIIRWFIVRHDELMSAGEEPDMLTDLVVTEADYMAALARIDELMDAKMGTPEGEELDMLTDLVALYEEKREPKRDMTPT